MFTAKAIKIFVTALFLVTMTPWVLYAQGVDSRLDKFVNGLETLSATFEQKLFSEGDELLETSAGDFYLRRPGMFHWSYRKPYSQLIISDGRSLWIYEEDLEQVVIKDISGKIEDSPAALLSGDLDIDAHYTVADLGISDGISWLELKPKDGDSQYNAIRLGFKENQISAMVLFDNLGQKNRITFANIKRNGSVGMELFQFDIPEGIDVIDERP